MFVRTAWLCDDAYITLRTVSNFVAGFGPRFNVAERVQAFTHPLWFLLETPVFALSRENFYTLSPRATCNESNVASRSRCSMTPTRRLAIRPICSSSPNR